MDFAKEFANVLLLRDQANKIEREIVHAALTETKGIETRAAKLLSISRNVLRAILKRLPDVAAEARAMREATGYYGGNPDVVSKSKIKTY